MECFDLAEMKWGENGTVMTLHKRNYQQCHCIDNCLMGKSTTDNSICSIRPQCLLFSHNFYKFISVHSISESACCKKNFFFKSYFHLCAGDKRQAQRDHIQISPGQRGDRTDPKKLPGHYQNVPGLYLSPHHMRMDSLCANTEDRLPVSGCMPLFLCIHVCCANLIVLQLIDIKLNTVECWMNKLKLWRRQFVFHRRSSFYFYLRMVAKSCLGFICGLVVKRFKRFKSNVIT